MIDAEARVARVVVRATHLGVSDEARAHLERALRGGGLDPARPVVADLALERGASDVAGMLALAFGGGDEAPDEVEAAALSLCLDDPARLAALLDRVDAAAPCWRGVPAWLSARGVAREGVVAALLHRAAVWVSLDGGLAAVGAGLRAALGEDVAGVARALCDAAGEAGAITVARAVRALLAPPPSHEPRVRAFVAALPPGLRGAAAGPLLARDAARYVDLVLAMARGEGGASSADRVSSVEALLRHRPEASAEFVDEVLAPGPLATASLRAETLRAHGRADPARFAAHAAAHAAVDPGEWAAELASSWPAARARPLWAALCASSSPSLVTRASEALLATPHPERGAFAASLLREPGLVSREAVLARCADLGDDELAPLVELLEDRASEVRLSAVRALTGRGAAHEAMVARHAVERAPRVRAAIVSALGYEPGAEGEGEAADPERAAIVARAEAARVASGKKPPRWVERCEVALRWSDGEEVPASVPLYLLRVQSLRGASEPDPEVVAVARLLDPVERVAWAESLLDAWIAADAPAKDHGALLLAALLGGAFASRSLRDAIPLWHKGSRRSMAATATQLLAMRGADDGLRALDELASGHPHESFGVLASNALDEEARARGLSVDVMLDLAAPSFGLEAGELRFELGHHVVRARLEGDALRLYDADGEALSALPRPARRDDPRLVAEMRRALKLAHLALPEAREREVARLIDAMASGRVWTPEHLARCLAHPVLGPLYRALWWERGGEVARGDALRCARAGRISPRPPAHAPRPRRRRRRALLADGSPRGAPARGGARGPRLARPRGALARRAGRAARPRAAPVDRRGVDPGHRRRRPLPLVQPALSRREGRGRARGGGHRAVVRVGAPERGGRAAPRALRRRRCVGAG
ncbi:MAG: DUF4132 domain-containing protein [Polyangiales bacterium]